jgi:RNA polymerase sigma-70 factor (ECF subfamily)
MKSEDPYPELEDDELIQAAFDDPDAFALLYRRYAPRVYRYAYSCVGNQEAAQDLTAQIFIEVLESLPRYRPQGRFGAWLFTIARHRAIDLGRKSRFEIGLVNPENLASSANDPENEVLLNEDISRLAGMFNDLNDQEKELIRLRFAAEMSYAEMSSALQRSRPALRMAMLRLMRRLRRRWEIEDE